jgi:hypothetical protein
MWSLHVGGALRYWRAGAGLDVGMPSGPRVEEVLGPLECQRVHESRTRLCTRQAELDQSNPGPASPGHKVREGV